MASHRVWLDAFPDRPGQPLTLTGEEAHHAVRVKRLSPGDSVEVLDGTGRVAVASVVQTRKTSRHGWEVDLSIRSVATFPRIVPEIEVWSAVPKGDRLEQMIDGLAQVGAAAWAPVLCERSVVDPREGKIARLGRVVHEACKQCGRPWRMRLDHGGSFNESLAAPGARVVVADASGGAYEPDPASQKVRLIVGPEGGWTAEELKFARATVSVACFGPHAMRIETAAVVAAAVVLETHRAATRTVRR